MVAFSCLSTCGFVLMPHSTSGSRHASQAWLEAFKTHVQNSSAQSKKPKLYGRGLAAPTPHRVKAQLGVLRVCSVHGPRMLSCGIEKASDPCLPQDRMPFAVPAFLGLGSGRRPNSSALAPRLAAACGPAPLQISESEIKLGRCE